MRDETGERMVQPLFYDSCTALPMASEREFCGRNNSSKIPSLGLISDEKKFAVEFIVAATVVNEAAKTSQIKLGYL